VGTWFYFWAYDFDMARYWGNKQCGGSHYIFEADMPYNDEILDLVGNRKQMDFIVSLMKMYANRNNNFYRWRVGTFIAFLKEKAQKLRKPQAFPFKAIRAIDHSATVPTVEYRFNE